MEQYEIAVLYHPDLEVDLTKAEERVTKLIKDNGGKVTATDNWGKRKLAYTIKKQEHAVYVFYTVQMPPLGVQKVEASLNITDEVIRYLITKPDLKKIAKAEALKEEKAKKDEPKPRLSRRYHSFAKRMHQTDEDELLEMYLTSMTSSFDPHTSYMSPSSLENFKIMMSLNLDGIGAQLKVEDGYTVIDKVVVGGAADKNGQLKVQDRVVQVGQGEEGEMVDVVDMKLNDVVKLIRGRAGTIELDRLDRTPGGEEIDGFGHGRPTSGSVPLCA